MSGLCDAEREIIAHSLGLDRPRRWSYRNHFVTGEGSTDYPVLLTMVTKGFARRRSGKGNPLTGGDDLFWITDAGIEAAGLSRKVRAEDRA